MKILWHTPSLFNSGTVSSFSTYWHFFKSSICNYEPGRLLKFQNKGQDTPQRWHQGKAPRLPCKTKVFLLSWEQVSSDHAQRAHKALMGGDTAPALTCYFLPQLSGPAECQTASSLDLGLVTLSHRSATREFKLCCFSKSQLIRTTSRVNAQRTRILAQLHWTTNWSEPSRTIGRHSSRVPFVSPWLEGINVTWNNTKKGKCSFNGTICYNNPQSQEKGKLF